MPIKRPTATAVLLAALSAWAPAASSGDRRPMLPLQLSAADLALEVPSIRLADLIARPSVHGADQDDGVSSLRHALVSLAMKLRHVRYVRGGHSPATGFDCSGFVRYVFAHAIGLHLPTNATGQFLAGSRVRRADLQPGDLVFFHTHGKRRVSHVGIYLDNGRFIHSPSLGKTVEVSSLDNAYWARRFVGARRPEGIAQDG